MNPVEGTPLSLRPIPVADQKPKNLAEFIARINNQPDGFRGISETKLRVEAANIENGHVPTREDDDVEMTDGEGDEEQDSSSVDPMQARMEVLKNIDIAGNTAMLTLDSLSLLLSKQNPTQASVTLSKHLREMAGIGTMGASRLDTTNVTPAKEKEQEDVAQGWTLMEINKAKDAAESASAFLVKEVEAESRYWEEVAGVQKSGWSLCKVPQERHTLGVRFGFSESTQDFKNLGLAPMRRGEDGCVQLDCGKLGGVSERIVVSCERDGQVIGRSFLPAQTDDNAPLETRVLEARNTIFSQELWYELSREARTLASYDVRPDGSSVVCQLDNSTKLRIGLVPLGSTSSAETSLPSTNVAETISITLHMLLSYSHRSNELLRIRPMSPHISRSRGQHVYPLLRPILARALHLQSIKSCTQHIGTLVQSLQKAGFKASTFSLHTPPPFSIDSRPNAANQPSTPYMLIRHILQSTDFIFKITLLNDVNFSIRGRTILYPFTATYFYIVLPPSSPLETICPPFKEGYPDAAALIEYIRTATARLLTDHFLALISKDGSWAINLKGNCLRPTTKDGSELCFQIKQETKPPSLHLDVGYAKLVKDKQEVQTWQWWAPSGGECEARPVSEVVRTALDSPSST